MRLNFWIAALMVAFAAPVARAAPAGALFDSFIRNCALHEGDAAGSLKAVSQQGWTPIPQDKLPLMSFPGIKVDWDHAYLSTQPGKSLALFAGQGKMFYGTNLPVIPVAFCMAIQKPIDSASLQQAGSWTGASGIPVGVDTSVYFFDETSTGRKSTTLAELYKHLQAGTGRQLMTTSHSNEHSSAIMIVAPVRGLPSNN